MAQNYFRSFLNVNNFVYVPKWVKTSPEDTNICEAGVRDELGYRGTFQSNTFVFNNVTRHTNLHA